MRDALRQRSLTSATLRAPMGVCGRHVSSCVGTVAPMQLDATAIRVLGCLVEKQMTTPDIYPLTLNSLVTACNQTTSRDPVVNLSPAAVAAALDDLRAEHRLVRVVLSGAGSRVDKYRHVLDDRLGLTPPEASVLAVLLLRGPQTVAELKSRTERHVEFGSLEAVDAVITRLCDPTIDADPSETPARSDAGMLRSATSNAATPIVDGYRRSWDGPLVIRLPRGAGQKEPRVAHLLGGPVDADALANTWTARSAVPSESSGWRERTSQLEDELHSLRAAMDALRTEFDAFRSQFG